MKYISIISLALLFTFIGCNSEKTETVVPDGTRKIEVAEYLDGGGYTFIKANENGKELWLAVTQMKVEVGDVLYFLSAMEMSNFESKTLNKTFETILFVDKIYSSPPSSGAMGNNSGMVSSADGHTKPKVEAATEIKVTPLAGGLTVEAVNKDRVSLAGKKVKVRGVVTKFNGGIMGRNWLHIQDGTSFGENVDLTVTTDKPAKVGDKIVIEGTVAVDKDFGAGYFYEVLIVDAAITVDKEI